MSPQTRLLSVSARTYQTTEDSEGLTQEESLKGLTERATKLSQEILSNNGTYADLKKEFDFFKGAPGFNRGVYLEQCRSLLGRVKQLNNLHKAQELQQQDLSREIASHLGKHLQYKEEEKRKIQEINRLISTKDNLLEIDQSLPKMRDGTSDFFEDCSNADTCLICFCCPCLWPCIVLCNPTCCGLKGRVSQLTYAIKKGIAS